MNDRFLRACRREPVDCTPVWMMRQAGRYMAEYRALREKHTLLELCKTPELALEVTLQPLKLGVDAAILFADILLPLEPMGAPFEFAKGEGPVIHSPVANKADVDKLRVIEPEEGLGYVLEAIKLLKKELEGAAHRLRRRAVHARELPRRGRQELALREDEALHVRGARDVAALLMAQARGGRAALPARADRRRRRGRPALRLVGRPALAPRTTGVRRSRTSRTS